MCGRFAFDKAIKKWAFSHLEKYQETRKKDKKNGERKVKKERENCKEFLREEIFRELLTNDLSQKRMFGGRNEISSSESKRWLRSANIRIPQTRNSWWDNVRTLDTVGMSCNQR